MTRTFLGVKRGLVKISRGARTSRERERERTKKKLAIGRAGPKRWEEERKKGRVAAEERRCVSLFELPLRKR